MLNVKFQSYGVSLPSLKAPCGIRKEQETKNQSGIPLVLGMTLNTVSVPVLFNIFMYDLFLKLAKTYFGSYTDNTPYTVQKYWQSCKIFGANFKTTDRIVQRQPNQPKFL